MFQPKNTQMEPESDSDWDSLPGDVQQPSSSPEGSPRHQPAPPAGSPRGQINHKRPQVKQQATLPSQKKTSITNSPPSQPRTKPDVPSSQMPSQLYGKAGVTNFVDRSGGINTTFIDRDGLDGQKNKDLQPPDKNENKVHQGSQKRGDIGIDIELNEADYHQRNPPYTDFKAAVPEQDSTRLGLQNDKPNKGKVKTSYVMTKDAQLEDHSWDSDSDALQDHVSHSRQHLTPRDKKSSKNYGHLEENNIVKEGISENQEGKLALRTFGVPQDIENQVTGYSYHFDHGNNYHFKVDREWKEAQMKKIADRSEKWLRYMWQEAFSSLRIVTDFVFIFVLELLRFVLHYIALRFLGGVITVTGDHFLKPFLALLFNSIIQPTFIFTRNVFAGVKNLLQPLLEISNTSIAQAASFLRAFRLFELNWKPSFLRVGWNLNCLFFSLCFPSQKQFNSVRPLNLLFSSGQWIFGKFSCNLWLFLNFLLCSASVYNLCVVSGDRYLAVTSPLKYLSLMNDHRIRNIIGISWLLAFVFAGFVTYGINVSKDNSDNCSIWGLRYEFSVTVLAVGYIAPVSFLVFVNGKVYCIAHSHMNRIHAQEMSLASASHIAQAPSIVSIPETVRNNQRPARTRLKQEIKMFKTFLIVICAFLICWTPFVVILLIDSILTVPGVIRHSSILLLYFNSALNPFIYGYFNTEFRSALSGSLIRLVKRL